MDDLVKMSEIYDEICDYKGWSNDINRESHLTLLEKKYRTILQKVVLRDIKQFKIKLNNYIKKVDAPIIRRILIMSTPGKENDKNCTRWLNGKLDIHDYKNTAMLFENLMAMLDDLISDNQIDVITYAKWEALFDFQLCGRAAMSALEAVKEIDKVFDDSLLLNNQNMPSIQDAIDKAGGDISLVKKHDEDLNDVFYEKNITQILEYLYHQTDYLNLINFLIGVIDDHVYNKSIELAELAVALMKSKNMEKSTFTSQDDNMADLTFGINYRLREYFQNNEEICKELEKEYDYPNLIQRFPVIDKEALSSKED